MHHEYDELHFIIANAMDLYSLYLVAVAVVITVMVVFFLIWILKGIYKAVILAYFTHAPNPPAPVVNPELMQEQEGLEFSDGAPPPSSSLEEEN
ncbi:hypothetical protein L195_g005641 [Trifolium pratense]|uniref:Uncharacterized protein n=1 Tax=Trifolium pratense TaxID=57577 RepID=A0A2K3P1C3_TRIPR|nr:hypothetical protein L195_g005641 [Trifolium pratense]